MWRRIPRKYPSTMPFENFSLFRQGIQKDEEDTCVWRRILVCGGGCLCVEEDTYVWRRILVCGGGYLCVEEDACVCRRILVCGGGYLCVEEDTCVWRRILVRTFENFSLFRHIHLFFNLFPPYLNNYTDPRTLTFENFSPSYLNNGNLFPS